MGECFSVGRISALSPAFTSLSLIGRINSLMYLVPFLFGFGQFAGYIPVHIRLHVFAMAGGLPFLSLILYRPFWCANGAYTYILFRKKSSAAFPFVLPSVACCCSLSASLISMTRGSSVSGAEFSWSSLPLWCMRYINHIRNLGKAIHDAGNLVTELPSTSSSEISVSSTVSCSRETDGGPNAPGRSLPHISWPQR